MLCFYLVLNIAYPALYCFLVLVYILLTMVKRYYASYTHTGHLQTYSAVCIYVRTGQKLLVPISNETGMVGLNKDNAIYFLGILLFISFLALLLDHSRQHTSGH